MSDTVHTAICSSDCPVLESWYKLYGKQDPRGYEELRQGVRDDRGGDRVAPLQHWQAHQTRIGDRTKSVPEPDLSADALRWETSETSEVHDDRGQAATLRRPPRR